MNPAKAIFQQDKATSERWGGWVHGADMGKVFVFADAVLVNHAGLTPDMRKGAMLYKEILLNLSEPDEPEPELPSTGLVHDIDPKRPTIKKPETKK